jgi:hypothetical protein
MNNFKIPSILTNEFRMPALPDFTKEMEDMHEHQQRTAGRYDAEYVFKHIMQRVADFQMALKETQEIGIQLANFGKAAEIHIREIKYKNPNLIEFIGVDLDQNDVALIQHINQLNFLLVAVNAINDIPHRIGFV